MRCSACFEVVSEASRCPQCGYDKQKQHAGIPLPVGTSLRSGEYLVGKVLGKPGGFGITYLAWDTHLDIKVAIKEFLPFQIAARSNDRTSVSIHTEEYIADFNFGLEKFLEESRTLAQFRHPNIIRILNFFQENGTAYMVMEYLEGESLAEYLSRVGKLNDSDAVALFLPILDGLDHIHAKNVLHRDIKPANIYLTAEGQPILLDFGSARQSAREMSRSLTAVITPGFAPWEQYHRKGIQGPWTDVYGCAATLYFMLTGIVPPDGAERAIDDDIKQINALAPEVDSSIVQAISRSLAVKACDRPQTAQELKRLLDIHTVSGVSVCQDKPENNNSDRERKKNAISSRLYIASGIVAIILSVVLYNQLPQKEINAIQAPILTPATSFADNTSKPPTAPASRQPPTTQTNASMSYISGDEVALRADHSFASKPIASLYKGDEVKLLEKWISTDPDEAITKGSGRGFSRGVEVSWEKGELVRKIRIPKEPGETVLVEALINGVWRDKWVSYGSLRKTMGDQWCKVRTSSNEGWVFCQYVTNGQ